MDDDEVFRRELINYIVENEAVNYLNPEPTIDQKDPRNITIELELFAGDRFKITIQEL